MPGFDEIQWSGDVPSREFLEDMLRVARFQKRLDLIRDWWGPRWLLHLVLRFKR